MNIPSNFTSSIDGYTFVPVTFPRNHPDGIYIENLGLDALVAYLQRKQLTKAYLRGFSNYDFLRQCTSLEHIVVHFALSFDEYCRLKAAKRSAIPYDLGSLYDLPKLKSVDLRETERPDSYPKCSLDLSRIQMLQMYAGNYKYTSNLEYATALRTLFLRHFDGRDLSMLCRLKSLDTFDLGFSSISSLDGCEHMEGIQCLYLRRNRSLRDIGGLAHLKKTLRVLSIVDCPNINDFSVIGQLDGLVRLVLGGTNKIPSLGFIQSMPNLKFLGFDVNILDGDLSPCKRVQWAYSSINRKHYNLRNEDLPKGAIVTGNENIELWRRLE